MQTAISRAMPALGLRPVELPINSRTLVALSRNLISYQSFVMITSLASVAGVKWSEPPVNYPVSFRSTGQLANEPEPVGTGRNPIYLGPFSESVFVARSRQQHSGHLDRSWLLTSHRYLHGRTKFVLRAFPRPPCRPHNFHDGF